MSLFTHCPNCTSTNNEFVNNQRFKCFDCGMVFYQNVAAAVAVIIEKNNQILFTIRNQEPKKGMLDLPGGFTDPDESSEEACARELKEELNLYLNTADFHYLESRPNSYDFKGITYKTTDAIFTTTLPDNSTFKLEQKEISDIKWIKKSAINPEEIGFSSLQQAIKHYLKTNS